MLEALKVDGGASAINFIMQFQSDIVGCDVYRPRCIETTALGAAYLAGLAVGFWQSRDEVRSYRSVEREFIPAMSDEQREKELAGWQKAVKAVLTWSE